MRHLIEIEDNGATYWVVAEDAKAAIRYVLKHGDRDLYNDEPPTFVEICTQQSIGATQFRFDGEDDVCSMWLAYMIARDFGGGILACSEWC